jgi:hypothetical protein
MVVVEVEIIFRSIVVLRLCMNPADIASTMAVLEVELDSKYFQWQ